ncbi:MAG: HU family DNA-binding protein [Rhodobacterales bacterium]|nr:HU family DNA-binding protein [Rhodobacterales bacterium]
MAPRNSKTAEPAPESALDSATPPAAPAAPVTRLAKKEFVDRVAAASGAKKKLAREIVEATLAALGDALSKGEDVVLPPLGRMRVSRSRDNASGEVLNIKLRRGPSGGKAQKDVTEPLAEAEE